MFRTTPAANKLNETWFAVRSFRHREQEHLYSEHKSVLDLGTIIAMVLMMKKVLKKNTDNDIISCRAKSYACDTEEHERLITEKLKKDGNTLESLTEYVLSILPPIEFVNEDEE